MSEKLLPLGSIVYLQEGIQKVIVVGRGPVIETKNGQRLFDYAASLYPLGINKDHLIKKIFRQLYLKGIATKMNNSIIKCMQIG